MLHKYSRTKTNYTLNDVKFINMGFNRGNIIIYNQMSKVKRTAELFSYCLLQVHITFLSVAKHIASVKDKRKSKTAFVP